MGIPASGKSTFYAERFMDTHMRISLDMLRTRKREAELFETCLRLRQSMVIDNTNASAAERARFLAPARAAGFDTVGYFFNSDLEECLARNAMRQGRAQVRHEGVIAVAGRLELPTTAEGFDVLHRVQITANGFKVQRSRTQRLR